MNQKAQSRSSMSVPRPGHRTDSNDMVNTAAETTLALSTLITFTLTCDDMANTTLYSSNDPQGKPAYTLITEVAGRTKITRVFNKAGDEIASLKGPYVTFPPNSKIDEKQKTVRLSNWMRQGFFRGSVRSFMDKKKRKYQWRNDLLSGDLMLRAKDCPNAPIARFQRSTQTSSLFEISPAALMLSPRALEIQDTVVASCLFLEQSRRSRLVPEPGAAAWQNALAEDKNSGSAILGMLLITLF
ncbi:hypothetical protein K439DRAFT_225356 [Ramaria rubella]|nr:hypothetical protein K439DRAFT_225356 [Ramaria rubella]